MLNSNESRVEGGIFGAYGDPPPVIYPRNFVWTRPDKHGDRSEALEIALLEEEKEEGVEITRYRRAVNVYRNIPPFSRWVLIFFASPPRSNETRKRERERYTTPAGKYELLNLDKGSRLNGVQERGEGRAIRQASAGPGLPVIRRNHGDCLFTPRVNLGESDGRRRRRRTRLQKS